MSVWLSLVGSLLLLAEWSGHRGRAYSSFPSLVWVSRGFCQLQKQPLAGSGSSAGAPSFVSLLPCSLLLMLSLCACLCILSVPNMSSFCFLGCVGHGGNFCFVFLSASSGEMCVQSRMAFKGGCLLVLVLGADPVEGHWAVPDAGSVYSLEINLF